MSFLNLGAPRIPTQGNRWASRDSYDNNAAERALRAVAVGRKNWLFFQTEGGGEAAVVMLSLVMSAKAAGIDPKVYLQGVLLRIARETDVTKLTPHGWREHYRDEVAAERQAVTQAFLGR